MPERNNSNSYMQELDVWAQTRIILLICYAVRESDKIHDKNPLNHAEQAVKRPSGRKSWSLTETAKPQAHAGSQNAVKHYGSQTGKTWEPLTVSSSMLVHRQLGFDD